MTNLNKATLASSINPIASLSACAKGREESEKRKPLYVMEVEEEMGRTPYQNVISLSLSLINCTYVLVLVHWKTFAKVGRC